MIVIVVVIVLFHLSINSDPFFVRYTHHSCVHFYRYQLQVKPYSSSTVVPYVKVNWLDRPVEKTARGSCDKKVPLAAFKEGSGGGGLLQAMVMFQPSIRRLSSPLMPHAERALSYRAQPPSIDAAPTPPRLC